MSIAEKLTTIAESMQGVYDKGFADGQLQGGGGKDNPFYYIKDMQFRFSGRAFSPERSNVVCRVLDCLNWNMAFGQLSGIKTLKIICDTPDLTVNWQALVRESADLELLDLTEFKCYPNTIAYFAYQTNQLVSIYGAFDLSQCTTVTSAFAGANALKDVEFVPNTIKLSMGFKDCKHLTKASLTSIINGLNTDVTEQTLTLSSTAKTNAFTDEEWATLIEAKPNWTISLM